MRSSVTGSSAGPWSSLGAIVFAGCWYGLYNVHSTPAVVVLYIALATGEVIFLWNMYAYVPLNFPTRMRGLGTGWTDGVGHLGAWGGVLLCGQVFTAAAPLGWILLVTIPGALLPGVMVGFFGIRQRRRTSKNCPGRPGTIEQLGRRLFPEVSPAAQPPYPVPGKTAMAAGQAGRMASEPDRVRSRHYR